MEQKEQPKVAYHWTNKQGQARITHLGDTEDLEELRQQFLSGANRGVVFVAPATGVVEGSVAHPIDNPSQLIEGPDAK